MDRQEHRFVAHGLVERQGKYLVLRRRDGRYLGGQWDIPGGTVEPGESPERATIRECAEESGMATRIREEIAHYENQDTKGRPITFHTITYILESVSEGQDVTLSPDEHDDFRWVTPQEARELPLVWHVERTFALMPVE